MSTCTKRLPATFMHDRLDRDLPCGEVEWRGNVAVVTADAETFADIKSDAEYQGWHTDAGPRDVINSARRAFHAFDCLRP